MNHRQHVSMLIFTLSALLSAVAPARAVVNEYQTLDLVRTYTSETEVRTAYPELFPKVNTIQINEKSIDFTDAGTGQILKQMPIRQFSSEFQTSVTEADLRQATQPILGEMVDRRLSDDKTLLLVNEGTIKRKGVDDFVEGSFKITKNTLYNANGDILAELPL